MPLAKHRCCPTLLPVAQKVHAGLVIQAWQDKSKQASLGVGTAAGMVQNVEVIEGEKLAAMSLGDQARGSLAKPKVGLLTPSKVVGTTAQPP